jgi:hypothetical protein
MADPDQDPFIRPFNPFQHPLVWCLQDYLQQQKAGASSTASLAPGSLHDTFVKTQDLQAATQVLYKGDLND